MGKRGLAVRVVKRPGEITSTSKARKEQSLCLQGDEEENIKKTYAGGWGGERICALP